TIRSIIMSPNADVEVQDVHRRIEVVQDRVATTRAEAVTDRSRQGAELTCRPSDRNAPRAGKRPFCDGWSPPYNLYIRSGGAHPVRNKLRRALGEAAGDVEPDMIHAGVARRQVDGIGTVSGGDVVGLRHAVAGDGVITERAKQGVADLE